MTRPGIWPTFIRRGGKVTRLTPSRSRHTTGTHIMPTRTFPNITPDQLAGFKAKLTEMGATVTDDKVTITKSVPILGAITIGCSYTYDGTSNLTLTILDIPSMVPEATVWGEIEKVIQSL